MWFVVYSQYSCSCYPKSIHNSVSFSLVTRLHIKYSAGNCEVVHVGKDNPSFTYKMMSSELTVASQEQGFGAMIENSTKTSAQIS